MYSRPGVFKPEKLDLSKSVTSANMEPAAQPAPSETPSPVPVEEPAKETAQSVQQDARPVKMADAAQVEKQNTAQTLAVQKESCKQPENHQEHNTRKYASGYYQNSTYTREVAALHTIIDLILARNYIAIHTGENKLVKIRGAP